MEFSTLYNVLNYAGKQFSSLSVPMRIHHFEKEMKDRTTKWVEASRSASQFLHAPAVLDDPDAYGIDGMKKSDSKTLLAERNYCRIIMSFEGNFFRIPGSGGA